jgi:hypothetical protein
MRALLDRGAPFTALFASNDNVALGAIAALHERGIRIPEDVAVVGYDDIPRPRSPSRPSPPFDSPDSSTAGSQRSCCSMSCAENVRRRAISTSQPN